MKLSVLRFLPYAFHGVLSVSVRTDDSGGFLRDCMSRGIPVKNFRATDGCHVFEIFAPYFLLMRKLGLTKGRSFRILSRKGFIRYLRPLCCRASFFVGGIFCGAFLLVMSRFVWEIDVVSEGVDNRALLFSLSSMGLDVGVPSGDIDNELIKNLALLEYDRLSWLAVNVSGCRAVVSYSLKREPPPPESDDRPCDIVASKPGVIKLLNCYKGTASAVRGQTVLPGELLISSKVLLSDRVLGETREVYVHARGEVWARTWYDITAYSPSEVRFKTSGDKIKRKVYLKIGERRINLCFGYGNHMGDCDIILKECALGYGALLCIEKAVFFDTDTAKAPDTCRSALEAGLTRLLVLSLEDGRIAAIETELISEDGRDGVRLVAECVQQIGEKRYLTTNDSGS